MFLMIIMILSLLIVGVSGESTVVCPVCVCVCVCVCVRVCMQV